MSLCTVLKPASQRGAFRGPEIDREHSCHIYNHTVSLWSVPLIFQRLVVIGRDGLGAQKEKMENVKGETTHPGLKY